jgi:hypothetical protein
MIKLRDRAILVSLEQKATEYNQLNRSFQRESPVK